MVQTGLRGGMGIAAVAHALALGTIHDVTAQAEILEGPQRSGPNPVQPRLVARECPRPRIIGPHQPTANVRQRRRGIESRNLNPPADGIIEPVPESAFPARTKDEGAMQPMGHGFSGILRELELDSRPRLARELAFNPAGKIHAHVHAIDTVTDLDNSDRSDFLHQPVWLHLLRRQDDLGWNTDADFQAESL